MIPGAELLAILRRAGLLVSAPSEDLAVRALAADSRTVTPGTLFIAVRGSQADGHRYINDAVHRGATAVVVEERTDTSIPQIVVTDARRAAVALAAAWYGTPADRLRLIGVTGTNGKTTTTALIRHLLNADSHAGSLGTLGAFDPAGAEVPSAAGTLTTPGPLDLQATLAELVSRGAETVVMEASSHSLAQGRVEGLAFAAAVFTNLTRDHLDYHATMEEYRAAKLRLLDYLAPDGVAVVNRDDAAWDGVPTSAQVVTFGADPSADLSVGPMHLDAHGSRFEVRGAFGTGWVEIPLLGAFNVANAAGAAACALALGEPLAQVISRLGEAPQVPGRMERLIDRPCVVLRDYAHTPDALGRALEALRPLTAGRLLVLFGCGGDRDRGKRPLMGRVAADLADLAIVTSDNPRTEDPSAIIAEIETGMVGAAYRAEPDRRKAIALVLGLAGTEDTVLLAGKGHETYQIVGTEKLPFDETEIVRGVVGI